MVVQRIAEGLIVFQLRIMEFQQNVGRISTKIRNIHRVLAENMAEFRQKNENNSRVSMEKLAEFWKKA